MAHETPARDDVADLFTGTLADLREHTMCLAKRLRDNREALGCAYHPLRLLAETLEQHIRAAECAHCNKLGTILDGTSRYCAECFANLHESQPEGTRAPGVFGAEAVGK